MKKSEKGEKPPAAVTGWRRDFAVVGPRQSKRRRSRRRRSERRGSLTCPAKSGPDAQAATDIWARLAVGSFQGPRE